MNGTAVAQKLYQSLIPAIEYFFNDPESYDETGAQKYFYKDGAVEKLQSVVSLMETNPFNAEQIEAAIRSQAEKLGIKAASLIHPVRLALSGRTNTPGLFEIMELLGATYARLD